MQFAPGLKHLPCFLFKAYLSLSASSPQKLGSLLIVYEGYITRPPAGMAVPSGRTSASTANLQFCSTKPRAQPQHVKGMDSRTISLQSCPGAFTTAALHPLFH